MINTKLSESRTRRVENEHVDIDPLRSEMDLDGVFEWFGSRLSSARRMNAMYGLLHMCQPLELRFLGACLEDLARKDSHVLRDFETTANGPTADLLGQLGDVSDPKWVEWPKLLVYLSLVGSDNRESAGTLYRALSQIDPISLSQSANSTDADSPSHSSGAGAAQTCQQHSPLGGLGVGSETLESFGLFAAGDAERSLEHFALLYTMASLHPAFSFQHREVAKLKLIKVEQEMERRRNIRHLKRMSSGKPNQTVQEADVVSSPAAQRGRSPQSQQTSPSTSPPGRDAVAIDCLLLKRVTWNRPNWEYTIEAQCSDSGQTTVTKTHHQLESFLSELPYVSSSQSFQKQLMSLLHQADQYEPRELEKKLRELLLTAPSAFRQREQICSYFLPHSQSKRPAQAPEQPQLNGLVERTSGPGTLPSNPQMTAEERWAHSIVWRGRGRNMEGPKKERHQVRRSNGFGAPSGLQRKLQEGLAVEEEEEEEEEEVMMGCAISTSNLITPPLGAAILQAAPTHTPGPMPNPAAPLTLSPALSPIPSLTSSLSTSPSSSPGQTPALGTPSEFDLSQSQRNLEQASYRIGLPTSSTGPIRSPTPWSTAPPPSPLSSHDGSPSAPLSSQVLLSSPQPRSPVCSPTTSSNSSPRGPVSSPVRKPSPQPNFFVCGPVPTLSPQSCSPIRSPVPSYSPRLPSPPVSSPVHICISWPPSSSFAPSPVGVPCPQPRPPAPRPASKSSPQLTTPAQSRASISSTGTSTPVKSPVFIFSPEPSSVSGSQTGLQPLVDSEKSSLASSAADGSGPFSRSVTEDQSQTQVEVLEKPNPEEILSQQHQNYSEPLFQKHIQVQSPPQHQNKTQDHNKVLSQENMIQNQLRSWAQTQSLPQSQAQEVPPQERMNQTRPPSPSQSPVNRKAQSPSPAPDLSPNPAPAQAAASGFTPVPATCQSLLARSHSSSSSVQPMASCSPLYAPHYSSLGLHPGAGLDQSSGAGVKKAAGGTMSCYNCGHSGHNAEDCKEPSKDPAQQGGFQLKYSTPHPTDVYHNTDEA